ncbi:MAG TPA: DUF2147 domain-containing protein [Candidatus Binatia bacterium]|nr:DUF2147 domain-containing protein [Candidatus Binatia bacterium]
MWSKVIFYTCVLLFLLSPCALAQAQETSKRTSSLLSPVGRWKTVDDATGKVKSVVVVWEQDRKLYGKIEKLVDPDPQDPDPRCTRCEGEMKDQPLIGLRILWDLKKDGDQWSGGKILDPDNGKAYRCFIVLEDGGKKLKVRGFIGLSLLGRTQHWLREQ